MDTSVITVRINSGDKTISDCMCGSPSMKTDFLRFVKDCIKNKSVLGLQCESPESEDAVENGLTHEL